MTPPRSPEPPSLEHKALDDLVYIRRTLESSGTFTAVSGRGVMVMGGVGVAPASLAGRPGPGRWLAVWLGAAVIAAGAGAWATAAKARRAGLDPGKGPGRRFLFGLLPSFTAGAALTAALARAGDLGAVPAIWLLLYGSGVIAAGRVSIAVVPVLGVAFMVLGFAALAAPSSWANLLLGAGFGGLNLGFGFWIARRHGG